MKTDETIKAVVAASIRRHGMDMDEWEYTRLWDVGNQGVKSKLLATSPLEADELPIVYSYIDAQNWTFVTTQRIFSSFEGETGFAFAKDIAQENLGNFKGYGRQTVERMQIVLKDGSSLFCPFETGKPSMGTIYGVRTLRQVTEP